MQLINLFVAHYWPASQLFCATLFAVPPPSPPVFSSVVFGENQGLLRWTQTPTDVVDDYTIVVETTTLSCVANVATIESTVPGSSREFSVDSVEESSTISITVTARNNGGEGAATVLTQTLPAGERSKQGTRGLKTEDQGLHGGTGDQGPRTGDRRPGSRTKDWGPGTGDRGSRTGRTGDQGLGGRGIKDWGDRGSRTGDRGSRTGGTGNQGLGGLGIKDWGPGIKDWGDRESRTGGTGDQGLGGGGGGGGGDQGLGGPGIKDWGDRGPGTKDWGGPGDQGLGGTGDQGLGGGGGGVRGSRTGDRGSRNRNH